MTLDVITGASAEIEEELARLRHEAARLSKYDLTIPGGRAGAKLDALVKRERELRALLVGIRQPEKDEP